MAKRKATSRQKSRSPRGVNQSTLFLVIVSLVAGALLFATPLRSSLTGQVGSDGIRGCEQPYSCDVSYGPSGQRYQLAIECGYAPGSTFTSETSHWCGRNEHDGVCFRCVDRGGSERTDGGTNKQGRPDGVGAGDTGAVTLARDRGCVVTDLSTEEQNAVLPAGRRFRVRGPCPVSFLGASAVLGPGVGNMISFGSVTARRSGPGEIIVTAGDTDTSATLVIASRSYPLVSYGENTPGLEGYCSLACMDGYDRRLCMMDDRTGVSGGIWFELGSRAYEGDVYRRCVERSTGVFPQTDPNAAPPTVYCDPTQLSNADPLLNPKKNGFSRLPSPANPDLVGAEYDMLTDDMSWAHAQCGMAYCVFDGDASDPFHKSCHGAPLPITDSAVWVLSNVDDNDELPGGGAVWDGGGMYPPSLLPPYGGTVSDNQIASVRRSAGEQFPGNESSQTVYIASQLWGRIDATGADYGDGSFNSLAVCNRACAQAGPNESMVPVHGALTGRPPVNSVPQEHPDGTACTGCRLIPAHCANGSPATVTCAWQGGRCASRAQCGE